MSARWFVTVWLALTWLLGGCTTKSSARRQAAEAFAAGQSQAMETLSPQGKVVHVLGTVRQHAVPWEEGLTLAAAIDAADYTGLTDPKAFVLRRGGETLEISVKDLLRGTVNPELQVGDVIEIRR
jgi:hypothetical protein